MVEDEFFELSKPLSIPGTSFKLNLGIKENNWAIKIYKGNSLLDFKVFDMPQKQFPDQNLIVQWLLQIIMIPNINPHQIMKTLQKSTIEALETKKKFLTSEEYIKEQLEKQKEMESAKIQLEKLKEKQKFLNIVLKIINEGGTGTDILTEYENHPANQVGILRSYDFTLKKIGTKKFLEYLEIEKKTQTQFKQINSAESFFNVIKTEFKYNQEKIDILENKINYKE